jgi:hypothetical protein
MDMHGGMTRFPPCAAQVFWPKLVQTSATFDASPFGARYRDDVHGFYRACASRLPLVPPSTAIAAAATTSAAAVCMPCACASDEEDSERGGLVLLGETGEQGGSADFDELNADCRGAQHSRESIEPSASCAAVGLSGYAEHGQADDVCGGGAADDVDEPPGLAHLGARPPGS